jgi:hypothetical protein
MNIVTPQGKRRNGQGSELGRKVFSHHDEVNYYGNEVEDDSK